MNNSQPKQKRFIKTIRNTEYTVIVEEIESTRETVLAKIGKLIERNCDRMIFERKRSIPDELNMDPLGGCDSGGKNQ